MVGIIEQTTTASIGDRPTDAPDDADASGGRGVTAMTLDEIYPVQNLRMTEEGAIAIDRRTHQALVTFGRSRGLTSGVELCPCLGQTSCFCWRETMPSTSRREVAWLLSVLRRFPTYS